MNTASNNFAVFILTHGRPDKVKTFETLRKQGYTGKIYIIIDDEDKTADEYRKRYGDQVIMFDKEAISKTFDEGDNFKDRRAVVFARNASFEIARDLGLEYFLQLDDDYTDFRYKFTPDFVYIDKMAILNLDRLFGIILDFYRAIPALAVAMGQGGDFQGAGESSAGVKLWLKRKAMNTFFCTTRQPFSFVGRINEDVNTYLTLGNRGQLFFTLFNVAINQITTQESSGGMTGLYESQGTYVKSFYTVMYLPSCVKISETGTERKRIHHRINWTCAVPRIISEQYCKRVSE